MSITKESKELYIRLCKLLKPYFKKISIMFICIIVSAGISMLLPLLSKHIMDDGLLAKNFSIVVKYSLYILATVLIELAIGLIETKYFSYVNSLLQYSLNKLAFKHIQRLKVQYFTNVNFSEIMNNIGMDVGNISRICDKGTFIILSQIFRIIGGLIGRINSKIITKCQEVLPLYTIDFIKRLHNKKYKIYKIYDFLIVL